MRTSLREWYLRLLADQRAVSLVEFAFIAPFLALLIVGIADLGRGYTARFSLQQAANRTLEMAILGTATTDYSFLQAEAASAAGVPLANVSLDQWLECDGGTPKAYGSTCNDGEQIARYVTLIINSTFVPLFTSAGYPDRNADGSVPIKARASLRVQ
jgi:Flp pilus assembly protein TadG